MTKQDFEKLAGIFAEEEAKIEGSYDHHGDKRQRAIELSILDSTVANFITQISDQYPRFNADKFRAASRPIDAYARKARIKAALAQAPTPDANLDNPAYMDALPEWMRDML